MADERVSEPRSFRNSLLISLLAGEGGSLEIARTTNNSYAQDVRRHGLDQAVCSACISIIVVLRLLWLGSNWIVRMSVPPASRVRRARMPGRIRTDVHVDTGA